MKEVKLYFDFKSPFAFLAKDPAFELPRRFELCVGWIPFIPRLEGKGGAAFLDYLEGAGAGDFAAR